MSTAPCGSTWRIFPAGDGHFRWVLAGDENPLPDDLRRISVLGEEPHGIFRLPSLTDLLLIQVPALVGDVDGGLGIGGYSGGLTPMFQTGSGKSVTIKHSSIQRAASILECGDDFAKTEDLNLQNDHVGADGGFPMFRTGSGKSVVVKESSLKRAAAVLEGEKVETGKAHPIRGKDSYNLSNSSFQTGSGRAVNISASGLLKASTLLGFEENHGPSASMKLNTEAGQVSIKDDLQDLLGFGVEVPSTSSQVQVKFHTAAGRSVSISSHALKRAKSLLGNPELEDSQADFGEDISNGKSCMLKPSKIHKNKVGLLHPACRTFAGPLKDISNVMGVNRLEVDNISVEKNRLQGRSTASPFKKPRNARFTAPLNNLHAISVPDTKMQLGKNNPFKRKVSCQYPFQFRRKSMVQYFGGPPRCNDSLAHLPDQLRNMNVRKAEGYRFSDLTSPDCIGPDDFQNMLLQAGASIQDASKEWVRNHYKWIVWKLACLERCYPSVALGKFLTVPNVLEELKYRYVREVNKGHKSAIRRILEGEASSSSIMILCVTAIYTDSCPQFSRTDLRVGSIEKCGSFNGSEAPKSFCAAKIELTDGWYSINAILDAPFSRLMASKKLFIGQKLRIWGAGLCGWVGPVSPLEVSSSVNLVLNINGTYRARWDSPFGFCKSVGPPLAFNCIKSDGGKIPKTLVAVTRIYPMLYKERFPDGGSVVRSEKMERNYVQQYNHRRSQIVVDILAEYQDTLVAEDEGEEGAKIFRMLQNSAEPEVLMADMSSEQLNSFAIYQAKQAESRKSYVDKKIEKALEEKCLGARDVTPFMRIRVGGLSKNKSFPKGKFREGLVTIWNPTEKQVLDLVVGRIYSVSGLMPQNFGSDILYLQCRGSSTMWKSLPSEEVNRFELPFVPRRTISLRNLGEVSLASEFDIVAAVVHVGKVYLSGRVKKQWVFATDESSSEFELDEDNYGILAISFVAPVVSDESSLLFSNALSGTTVAFCNLIKRSRDQTNHLWIAEATEIATYSLCCNIRLESYLAEAADRVKKWVKVSAPKLQRLKEKIFNMLGGQD